MVHVMTDRIRKVGRRAMLLAVICLVMNLSGVAFGIVNQSVAGSMSSDSPTVNSIQIHGTVAVASNYQYRGIDLSNNDTVKLLSFNVEHQNLGYVGGWSSPMDFIGMPYVEKHNAVYVGSTYRVSPNWVIDAAITRYQLERQEVSSTYYSEISVGVHFQRLISTSHAYSEEMYGLNRSTWVHEVQLRHSITSTIDFDVVWGFSRIEKSLSLNFQHQVVSVSYTLPNVQFKVSRSRTDNNAKIIYGDTADTDIILSVVVGF